MAEKAIPLQVGSRPRCRGCNKELAPQFTSPPMPREYQQGFDSYHKAARTWEKEKRYFTGHYGRYLDDLFCGLNCGYRWAVDAARKQKSTQR